MATLTLLRRLSNRLKGTGEGERNPLNSDFLLLLLRQKENSPSVSSSSSFGFAIYANLFLNRKPPREDGETGVRRENGGIEMGRENYSPHSSRVASEERKLKRRRRRNFLLIFGGGDIWDCAIKADCPQ